MFLDAYFNDLGDGQFSFSREQASRFAKEMADDYNPIHDVDAKRFCVPGDLLFALVASRLGLRQQMSFRFAGMVTEGLVLELKQDATDKMLIRDAKEKEYLHVEVGGAENRNEELIQQLVLSYIRFSGHNFPHILQPLMEEHQVMINPARPLVMYESMALDFSTLACSNVELHLTSTEMQVEGKRGNVLLRFEFTSDGTLVGHGEKRMVLGSLQPYQQEAIEEMIARYDDRKQRAVR